MENNQTSKKLSGKARIAVITISIVGATLVLFSPFIFFGLNSGQIGPYPGWLVAKKLSDINPRPFNIKADANGDWLTGTGTYYEYTSSKNFKDPIKAVKQTYDDLRSVGLPVPSKSKLMTPDEIHFEGVSVGSIPSTISIIRIDYSMNLATVSLIYTLDKPVECNNFTKDDLVICKDWRTLSNLDGFSNEKYAGTLYVGGDIPSLLASY